MSALPPEAEKLFAVEPGKFVAERKRIAEQLKGSGRAEEAAEVAGLAKPTAVVFAVNRAARDRPNAARDAADAATRVLKAQLGGDSDAYTAALEELKRSLDLLAEVADTHVAPRKSPTEAMRRRIRDLLRSAVADDETREALRRGALAEEVEAPGFSPFAGMTPKRPRGGGKGKPSASNRAEEKRRERERELREELEAAESGLREAESAAREAERERARAERKVTALRKKLDR